MYINKNTKEIVFVYLCELSVHFMLKGPGPLQGGEVRRTHIRGADVHANNYLNK